MLYNKLLLLLYMHNKYKNNSRWTLKHVSTWFFSKVMWFNFLCSNYTVAVVPVMDWVSCWAVLGFFWFVCSFM